MTTECRFCGPQPTVTVDPETGSVYVNVLDWPVHRVEEVAVGVTVDYGVGSHVVGIEVLR